MPADHAGTWTDRAYLRGRQYRTDANLAARQAIYAWQRPRHDIARLVIDLAGLDGNELVTDVGCGNGAYLSELDRRGHPGPVLGVDLSPGMLRTARPRAPGVALAVADAAALPLPDQVADVTLAVHMLYHMPKPVDAVRELRRVTRPGGRVLVGLNAEDHLRELREALGQALAHLGLPSSGPHERLSLGCTGPPVGRPGRAHPDHHAQRRPALLLTTPRRRPQAAAGGRTAKGEELGLL